VSNSTDPGREDSPQGNWLRREWRLLVGLGLSVACLWLALREVSFMAVGEVLSAARWEWVALAGTVGLIITLVKAMRWQALFLPRQLPLGKVWSVFMIGQMLNAVLPARAGEVGRVFFIGGVEGVSRVKALSTVIVEKMVDLVMLSLAYLLAAAWLVTTPVGLPDWVRDVGTGLILLAALALGALMLFVYAGQAVWRLLRRALSPLPPSWRATADRNAERAIGAFEALQRWPVGVRVWCSALLIWTLTTLTNYLVFHAFRLDLSPEVALVLVVVLMSGVAIPPLPGNLGVFPYLCMLVLSLYGVNRETSLVYGVTLQMVSYLPVLVLGSACMFRENWSLRRSSVASGKAGRNGPAGGAGRR